MIVFKDVSKVYGSRVVLDHADFTIEDGEFVIIEGPTGSGKSTIIKLITREILPDSGEIIVDDTCLSDLAFCELPLYRRKLGMVFQDFRLLPGSNVYDNIDVARRVASHGAAMKKNTIPAILDLVQLGGFARYYPHQLSGGEQQRVAIARAIVNNPRYIIADEPTGNLDPETAKLILDLLLDINSRGTTVIMVTHAVDMVRDLGKRIIVLNNGMITKDEPREDF